MKAWFSNLGKLNQIATTIVTLVTLIGLLWVGYGKLTDWIGPDAKAKTPWLGLQVWQEEAPNDIFVLGEDQFKRKVEVPIEPKPFEIRLPQQKSGSLIAICAWTDASIFKAEIGMKVDTLEAAKKNLCLGYGRGMATTDALALKALFLDKNAFSAYVDDRMATIGGQNRIFVQKVWQVNAQPKKRPIPLEQFDQDIFLLVFVDTDDDQTIDVDEYQDLVLRMQE